MLSLASWSLSSPPTLDASTSSGTRRYELVDTARGLCLIWMCLAHVFSTFGSENSWIRHLYLPGWSTTNFVMLTGLSLALVASRKSAAYWHKRALQVLAAAYLSNVIFNYWRIDPADPQSYLRVFLLQEPWTISSILIPTAVLLFFSSRLESVVERVGETSFFLFVSVSEVLGWRAIGLVGESTQTHPVFRSLFEFGNPTFTFPLGLLLALGIWAYSLGTVFRSGKFSPVLALASVLVISLLVIPGDTHPSLSLYLYRFSATLAIAGALCFLSPAKDALGLLGRSSLLVFLLHRFLLQAEKTAQLEMRWSLPFLFFLTLILCGLVCLGREKNLSLHRGLKRLGL